MKYVTLKLTYSEVKTVYKALEFLLDWDKGRLHADVDSEETKKNFEEEMERCMILLDFDGAVYEAWKEAHKEEE